MQHGPDHRRSSIVRALLSGLAAAAVTFPLALVGTMVLAALVGPGDAPDADSGGSGFGAWFVGVFFVAPGFALVAFLTAAIWVYAGREW